MQGWNDDDQENWHCRVKRFTAKKDLARGIGYELIECPLGYFRMSDWRPIPNPEIYTYLRINSWDRN